MYGTCEECGTTLHCINPDNDLCGECDLNYKMCKECELPCRNPEERDKIFKRMRVNIDEINL